MFGWRGHIARIDLSGGIFSIEKTDPDACKNFIGGRGMAGYLLKDHITLAWDDPHMPVLFFTGPLVDTASPTSGRMTVMSKSPLTGTVGDASVGGTFGTMLKRAGLDGLVITGKSENLCGIDIADHRITIIPAAGLAGKCVDEVNTLLTPGAATAVIGPAAENGVRFSSIIFDGNFAAGRSGLGLVLAAKNIKYITVSGSGKTSVYDPAGLKTAADDIIRLVSASPALMGDFGFSRFGTPALYDLMDARRMMPTDNFQKSRFPQAPSMNAHALRARYAPISAGCRGCHIRCKKKTSSGDHLPEFETLSHFSALIGNRDLDTAVAANRFCNATGMDTISAASTLACYFEISGERPNPDRILSLLNDIAFGRGIGSELGSGAAWFATTRGRPEAAMCVKGLELPAYDPRGAYGMALAYAVATRGGCHLRAYPISHEILRKPVPTDRFTFTGKARIIKIQEDINAAADALTACKFIFFAASLEEFAQVFSAVTGVPATGRTLSLIGERICFQERIMNARLGFAAEDDDLPRRFFEQAPIDTDADVIHPINQEEFVKARSAYYKVRGLDKNGRPLPEKAETLGLVI